MTEVRITITDEDGIVHAIHQYGGHHEIEALSAFCRVAADQVVTEHDDSPEDVSVRDLFDDIGSACFKAQQPTVRRDSGLQVTGGSE